MTSPSHPEGLLDVQPPPRASTSLYGEVEAERVESPAGHLCIDGLRRWCYFLHTLLCILHFVLLAMLWHHPENAFTTSFNNGVLSSGLSAFLQAFYTLYTALLVFITQRLALSAAISRSQKLTTTHDISESWGGLGASILTLWRQTKIAASVSAVISIVLYFTCISVLHVASPTIMQFQPYNASQGTTVASNSTWPRPSVNLTTLEWGGVTPIAPLLFNFGSSVLSTRGLINSTLYDAFPTNRAIVNASVNASTIRANCGLLQILSSTDDSASIDIHASLGTARNMSVDLISPWKDEILFLHTAEYQCNLSTCLDSPLLFLTSTALELNSSIPTPVSVNATWLFTPTGGEPQNSSTTLYPIACSLDVLHHEMILNVQQNMLWSTMDYSNQLSQEWSIWSSQATPGTDSQALDTGVLSALLVADFPIELAAPGPHLFCQQELCPAISTIDVYLMSLLGVNASANSIMAVSESSAHPSKTLTPAQMEAAISQLAAELIWLAGQLGQSNGGFQMSPASNDAVVFVLRWKLNINQVSVICALAASLGLLAITFFVISGSPTTQTTSVSGISVLETLWIGTHVHKLQDIFCQRESPSMEELRATGLFDVCLISGAQGSNLEEPRGSHILIGQNLKSEVEQEPEDKTNPSWKQLCFCQVDSLVTWVIQTLHVWCYVLHGILVAVHITLVAMFAKHMENHIILPLDSTGITTAFKASLQLFYTLYTAVLVFMLQRLTICHAMTSKCGLSSIHDISNAWMGVGSAINSLLQQRKGPVSFWITLWTMVYFSCISILHISSSTIMEFQPFNSTVTDTVQSRLAWPNLDANLQDLDWTSITPLVTVVDELPNLLTEGLYSNIVYDTPSSTPNALNATVNTTFIDAHCGMLSNLTLISDDLNNVHSIIFTTALLGTVKTTIHPMWNNTVLFVEPSMMSYLDGQHCTGCDGYLFFSVSTAMDLDSTSDISGISVGVNWTDLGGSPLDPLITTYLVGCSLNATTALETLDLQNDFLSNPDPVNLNRDTSLHSQQWTLWSPVNGSAHGLDNCISYAMSSAAPLSNCPVNPSAGSSGHICFLTTLEVYFMERLGINLTQSALTTGSSTTAVVLGQYQFEKAVSEIAAQLIWLASHVDVVGFPPAYGTSEVATTTVRLRLNINIIPLVFALGASVTIFLLAFYMVGVTQPRSLPISSLGVLETLWLGSRSRRIQERMLEVDHPSLDNLRTAGMIKVCIADELAAKKESGGREDNFLILAEDD